MVFDATITEINDYPEDANGYYGSGNPNASYYGYTAYIEDSTGLGNGDNLSLSINLGGDEDASDKIYLDKAYVRKEDGKSYVMNRSSGKAVCEDRKDHIRICSRNQIRSYNG